MTTEEKSLTTIQAPGAVSEWTGSEWESDGTDDIAPSFPVVKIVQNTSQMEGASKNIGRLWRSDTEEFFDHLECVPLFKKNTRALFAPDNDQPLCASNDGIEPRPNMPLWSDATPMPEAFLDLRNDVPPGKEPTDCDTCPFSQWIGDNPPPCKSSINVLIHHQDSLAQLRISGKSIKPFKQFVARKLAPKKLPLCSQRLDLFTEEHKEPGKKWFQLCIDATLMSPAEGKLYNAVLRDERSRFESSLAIEPDDEEPAAGGRSGRSPQPSWGDGSASFRDRVEPVTERIVDPVSGEITELTPAQSVLAGAAAGRGR